MDRLVCQFPHTTILSLGAVKSQAQIVMSVGAKLYLLAGWTLFQTRRFAGAMAGSRFRSFWAVPNQAGS